MLEGDLGSVNPSHPRLLSFIGAITLELIDLELHHVQAPFGVGEGERRTVLDLACLPLDSLR